MSHHSLSCALGVAPQKSRLRRLQHLLIGHVFPNPVAGQHNILVVDGEVSDCDLGVGIGAGLETDLVAHAASHCQSRHPDVFHPDSKRSNAVAILVFLAVDSSSRLKDSLFFIFPAGLLIVGELLDGPGVLEPEENGSGVAYIGSDERVLVAESGDEGRARQVCVYLRGQQHVVCQAYCSPQYFSQAALCYRTFLVEQPVRRDNQFALDEC